MKRIFTIGYATLLFASVVYAQEETPAPPPLEPQKTQKDAEETLRFLRHSAV